MAYSILLRLKRNKLTLSSSSNEFNFVIGTGVMDTEEKEQQVKNVSEKADPKPKKRQERRKPASKRNVPSKPSGESQPVEEAVAAATVRKVKFYRVKFFYEWCKSCGICAAMCPKKIILLDDRGNPLIEDMDGCIGCRNCEIHCPDFAITVKRRYPERRRSNGSR